MGRPVLGPETRAPVMNSSWRCYGLVYHNPNDPKTWVSKQFGWGWTLNFASSSAWVWLGTLGAFVAASLLSVRLQGNGKGPWVPKHFGWGWTLSLSHPQARWWALSLAAFSGMTAYQIYKDCKTGA